MFVCKFIRGRYLSLPSTVSAYSPEPDSRWALSQLLINGYWLFDLGNYVNSSMVTPCVLTYYLWLCVLL